ncbi:uncharacterized protein LOC119178327 [Rhipicephalus microplus]|uniref:uncharacterized protein LOC119178327 n=1 Tax=Rhipicephalus microplus TaxID=6941 RepID=UPI003F6CDCF9
MKMELVLTGSLIAEGFNALCENQGFLLKALLNTYECWNIEVFISCIEQLSLMTESYEASELTDQDLNGPSLFCQGRRSGSHPAREFRVAEKRIEQLCHPFQDQQPGVRPGRRECDGKTDPQYYRTHSARVQRHPSSLFERSNSFVYCPGSGLDQVTWLVFRCMLLTAGARGLFLHIAAISRVLSEPTSRSLP